VWGYLAGFVLLGLMVIPALVGIVLGVGRAPREASSGNDGDRGERVDRRIPPRSVTTLLFG
jgi:hypothetical protein